jgi:hypothetical protein
VTNAVLPTRRDAGASACRSTSQDPSQSDLKTYHGWLIEEGGDECVRILTQEVQIGSLAAQLRKERSSRLLIGHQGWIEGLLDAAASSGEMR